MSTVFEPLPMTDRAFRAMVANKLVARDHWIFLPGREGLQAVQEIERRFYRPGAGSASDFAQYVTPLDYVGVYGFAFAHKRRLSAEALAAFIRTQPLEYMDSRPFTAVDLKQHDVIVLAAPEEAVILIENFFEWVGLSYESPSAS